MFSADHSLRYALNSRWTSIEHLIEAHADGLRLDIGCGYYKPAGFVGLDNLVGVGTQIPNEANAPDVFIDLNHERFPFPDHSCDEVRSSHFLEHSNLDHVINESHRVLKTSGTFAFTVPYANSAEGMYPGHTLFLTEKWFHENLNFRARFEIFEETFKPSEEYQRLPRMLRRLLPFDLARTFMFNVCSEMTIRARPRH